MKVKDIEKYLNNTSIDDIEVDFTRAIISDSFNNTFNNVLGDYRNRAIDKIIKSKQNWYAEHNIAWEVSKRFVKIICPYCNAEMGWHGSTGYQYVCNCGAIANIDVKNMTFNPKR